MKKPTTDELMGELLGIRREQQEQVKATEGVASNDDILKHITSENSQQTTQLQRTITDTIQKEMANTKLQPNNDSSSLFVNTAPKEPEDKFDKESAAFKYTWQELLTRLDIINTKIAGFPTELKLSADDNKSIQSLMQMLEKNATVVRAPEVASVSTPVLTVEKVDTILSSLDKQVTSLNAITDGIKQLTKPNAQPAIMTDNAKLIEAITALQESTKTTAFEQTKQQLQAIQTLRDSFGSKSDPINKEVGDALVRLSKLDLNAITKEPIVTPVAKDEKLIEVLKQAQADISFIKGLNVDVLDQLKKIAEQGAPLVNTTIKPIIEKSDSIDLDKLIQKIDNAKSVGSSTVTLDKQSIDAIKAIQGSITPELVKSIELLQQQVKNIPTLSTPVVDSKQTLEVVKSTITDTISQVPQAAPAIVAPASPIVDTKENTINQGNDILESINSLQNILSPALLKIPDALKAINVDVTKKMPVEQVDGILKGINDVKATQAEVANVNPMTLELPSFDSFFKEFDTMTSKFEQISKIEPGVLTKGMDALSAIKETKLDSIVKNDSKVDQNGDMKAMLQPIMSELVMPSIKQEIAPLVKPIDIKDVQTDITKETVKDIINENKSQKVEVVPPVAPTVSSPENKPNLVSATQDINKVSGSYDDIAKAPVSVKFTDASMMMPNVKQVETTQPTDNAEIVSALHEQIKTMKTVIETMKLNTDKPAPVEQPKENKKDGSNAVTNISLTKNQAETVDWQQALISEIRKLNAKFDTLSNTILRKSVAKDDNM